MPLIQITHEEDTLLQVALDCLESAQQGETGIATSEMISTLRFKLAQQLVPENSMRLALKQLGFDWREAVEEAAAQITEASTMDDIREFARQGRYDRARGLAEEAAFIEWEQAALFTPIFADANRVMNHDVWSTFFTDALSEAVDTEEDIFDLVFGPSEDD